MTPKRSLQVRTKVNRTPATNAPADLSWPPWLVLLLMAGLCRPSAAHTSASTPEQPPTRYMIVVTGGELLSGAYADGHTLFITRTLRPLGLQCVGSMCVDDKRADLAEALHFATSKATLVIVTGGLGPTDNDITRQALADFTKIPLREHPDVLKDMAQRFRTSPDRLRSNLRRQTQVPTHGSYFKNANGTAVGLAFEQASTVIVALPGPPHELQPMVRAELVPYLNRRFGTRLPGCSLTLRFVGLGQSQIDQTLKDHVQLAPDITVSSQFEGGRVDFTFALPNDTPQDRARLDELKQGITKHLGEYMYGEGDLSLEQHVIRLLESRGQTLALAEVGSAGSLTAALSSVDSAGQVVVGAYVAPTENKLRRMLGISDDQWADSTSQGRGTERLAALLADVTTSQWAIVVGEPRRDQSGAEHVQVIFRRPDGRMDSRNVRAPGTNELAGARLTTNLLDLLRRSLQ